MNAIRPMMIKQNDSNFSSTFEPVSAGTHSAVCVMLVDIGYQPGYEGRPQHKVYIAFDIPAERAQWTDKDGKEHEGPKRIGSTYTHSLSEKSTLYKHLSSWRGKPFTDSELGGFDLSAIIGKPCLIAVTHKQDGDKLYANITAISPLMKGMAPAKPETELLVYRNVAEDNDLLDKLPKWLQRKLEEQLDMSTTVEKVVPQKAATKTVKDSVETPATEPEFNDEIPF